MSRTRNLLFSSIFALTLIFFWKLVFSGMILARGDTYAYFYPYWDARNAAMRAGELPLWTPDIFMGAPLLANPQLGTFYPPNWLTIPFRAPDAIRISILIHMIWAASGVVILFRRTISKALVPALAAGAIFAFSGYIGAHVEQINQLQGLAWMPWLFYLFHQTLTAPRRWLWIVLLAMGLALQIFSGHTQTVFITGAGLGMYALHSGFRRMQKRSIMPLLILVAAVVLAVLLAMPQILPALELTGMSNRGGGFTSAQATAFSLSPTYLGRALLPSYDAQLFGEYVGYVGVLALGLAFLGMITPFTPSPFNQPITDETSEPTRRNDDPHMIWIVIAFIGFAFALGRYNPLYWNLAELPGFNLFRVPARWLSLYALAMSMLAGVGLHALGTRRIEWARVVIASVPLIILMVAGHFVFVDPVDIVGGAVPTRFTLMMWGAGLVLFVVSVFIGNRIKHSILLQTGIFGLIVLELFLAARVLPYNDLAPRDVYEGQRFTISQLLAYNQEKTPPGRILAISRLYFDPGDKERLQQRYQRYGMDEQAIGTAFTAVKRQEMLYPNLALRWGIPTIDGFGGGVLPTIYYSQFTSLLLPDGTSRTVDGRLGELMALPECRGACIPELSWLLLTDTRYIIADKVYDVWQDGIAYDTSWSPQWWAHDLPQTDFAYTEVHVLHSEPLPGFGAGSPIEMDETLQLTVMDWDELRKLIHSGEHSIHAVTLVDTRTGAFEQITPFRRVLSSDIKLYDLFGSPSPSQRVYLTRDIVQFPDDWQGHEDAVTYLREHPNQRIAAIHGDAPLPELAEMVELAWPAQTEILSYSPTRIEIRARTIEGMALVLNDAYYPGWRATINGEPTEVYRANVMFRAVQVPAGESTIVFEFVPTLWYGAIAFGVLIWMLALGWVIGLWWKS